MVTIYKEVEIDVDLDDFTDSEIAEAYESRQLNDESTSDCALHVNELITEIYNAKTSGKSYETLLNQLIYGTIGRIC